MKAIIAGSLCLAAAAAAPAPEPTAAPDPVVARAASSIVNFSQLGSSISALQKGSPTGLASGYAGLLSAIKPSATPTNSAGFSSAMASAYKAFPTSPLAAGAALLLSGLTNQNPFGNPLDDLNDFFGPCNSYNNVNTQQPSRVIYPKHRAGPSDAPYDVSEASLRAAMYFPPSYTNGKVKPVIFLPGTGGEACQAYAENIGKVITASNTGDPVYLNVPKNMLDDQQLNSQYIAYAVNYVSATTGRNDTAVISWSAGGPAAQWAFKYWPSTRSAVSSFIPLSPDFHGTIEVPILCPPGFPCSPAVIQQNYNSNWITTLRKNGGANALVPSTPIYNIFDEIVEPQQNPLASANLGQGSVPVTNVQIQDICSVGTAAGGPNFGHENVLYNPVAIALINDALKNGGAANVKRAGPYNCTQFMASGISFSDVFASEALIPYAGYNIETYPNKTTTEPPIRAYAQ